LLARIRDYDILFLLNSKAISNGNFASIGLPIKVVVYRGVVGGLSWLNPNSYLKHLHPRVDIILAVSKTIQKYIQSQIWWNRKKVRQFYKGQNIDWFKSISPINQKELGLPKKAFIVTCIANNRKIKGVRYLLESTNNLPPNLPIHFLLIGRKIDSKENLEIIRSSIYRDQIHLLGYRDDVCSILAISNIYIQPSLKEGLGKAILEAMSLGIPLIVTDSGGPNEYIKHMDSGILIPPKNSKEIAKQIEKLYKNEELRISIGKSAKLVIIEKLSIKDSISKLDRIIKSIHK